jgi:hypothetical protein
MENEGNTYDKIFKENAEAIFIPFIESLLDNKIKRKKRLPEKFQKTLEERLTPFLMLC